MTSSPWVVGNFSIAILVGLGLPARIVAESPLSQQSTGANPSSWSEFHGVNAQGFIADGSLPNHWSDSDYAWRHDTGDYNVGSPIVANGYVIFLASDVKKQTIAVRALDLKSGQLAWQKPYPHHVTHLHSRNTAASSTVSADASNLFCSWSDPEHTMLKCFDFDGNEIWSRDFGTWQSQHGFGTSPRIFGSLVILFNSQQGEELKPGDAPGQSRMIAVDRSSGETVWETPLKTTRTCYGVPAIFQDKDGAVQVIGADTGNGLFGLDAKTGKMLWNLPVFGARCCSTPLVVGDLAIATAGSGGGGNHLVAVRIPQSKNEKPEQVYRIDRGSPYVPTPAKKGNRLFIVDDKGIASCVDVTSGETIWKERIGGNFGASPIIVNDTVLIISLDGKATLMRAGDKFEKLGQVDLGGAVGATPAYSNGRLLLRVGNEIRCLQTSKS